MFEELDIAELLKLGSGLFALSLLFISLLAYYRSRQRRLLFVSGAFGLYFIKVIAEHLDLFIPDIENSFLDLLLVFIDFIILLLFFLAILKSDRKGTNAIMKNANDSFHTRSEVTRQNCTTQSISRLYTCPAKKLLQKALFE